MGLFNICVKHLFPGSSNDAFRYQECVLFIRSEFFSKEGTEAHSFLPEAHRAAACDMLTPISPYNCQLHFSTSSCIHGPFCAVKEAGIALLQIRRQEPGERKMVG